MLSPAQWDQRFHQQAIWTEPLRQYLYDQCELTSAHRVLEVGCGSGVISADLQSHTGGQVVAIDINTALLSLFLHHHPHIPALQADGLHLPFAGAAFDQAYCHFLLLWIAEPLLILQEMKRVVKSGGYVIALAEPDYAGRIDFPPPLELCGQWQAQALQRQGANPNIGRSLRQWFTRAGLKNVQAGVMGGQWRGSPDPGSLASEWEVLRSDLAGEISTQSLVELQQLDEQAWRCEERILFVPTFYAVGIVP